MVAIWVVTGKARRDGDIQKCIYFTDSLDTIPNITFLQDADDSWFLINSIEYIGELGKVVNLDYISPGKPQEDIIYFVEKSFKYGWW